MKSLFKNSLSLCAVLAVYGLSSSQVAADISNAEQVIDRVAGIEFDEDVVFAALKKAAEAGNTEAYYGLGRCYLESIGTKFNPLKAFEYAQKSHEAGDKDGKRLLARTYQHGCQKAKSKGIYNPESKDVEVYYEYVYKAIELLKECVKEGDKKAEIALIQLYTEGVQAGSLGKNDRVVRKEGNEMLNKLVSEGDPTAQWMKAKQLLEESPEEAQKLAQKAVDGGEYRALVMVARFLNNKGETKKAGKYLFKGIAAGDTASMVLYSEILAKHSTSKQMTAKWMKYMKRLEEKGYPSAMEMLGDFYANKNVDEKALAYYSKAHQIYLADDNYLTKLPESTKERVLEICGKQGGIQVKSVANYIYSEVMKDFLEEENQELLLKLEKLVMTHKDLKGDRAAALRLFGDYKLYLKYSEDSKRPEKFENISKDGSMEMMDRLEVTTDEFNELMKLFNGTAYHDYIENQKPLYEEAALMHPLYPGQIFADYKVKLALSYLPSDNNYVESNMDRYNPKIALGHFRELLNASKDGKFAGKRIPNRKIATALSMLGKKKEGANFLYLYVLSEDVYYVPTYEGQRNEVRPENVLTSYLYDKKNQAGIEQPKVLMFYVKLLRQREKKDVTDADLKKFSERYNINTNQQADAKKMLETKKLGESLFPEVKDAVFEEGNAPSMN